MVQPDPVRSIHFLLDIPGYDEVLATVQRVLQRGRRQRGPAVGGHQICVAVGPRKPNVAAGDGDGVHGSSAPFRQRSQVFRAQGVPQVRAAPSRSRQVLTASRGGVGRIVGTGPGWEDSCGEGGTHGEWLRRTDEEEARDEKELAIGWAGR